MEDYKTYRLGDIAEMRYGKLPPESILEGKYPVYSGYRVVGFTNTFNCKKGSIIVIARGVGGTGDVKLIKEDCFLTNLSISVVLDPAICNSAYFYYKYKMCNLRYLDSGSAQSQITIEDLKRLELKLPPISKQLRVVSVLQTLDNKIDLNKRINHNLEEQAKALYKSWFVDFEPFKDGKFIDSEMGLIPEGWEVKPMRTILEYSKKSINPQKYPETIFTHYSLPAYDNSKEPEVQKGYEIMSNKFVIEDKMILFSKLNPRIKRIWYIDDIPMNSICSTEFIAYKALDRNTYPYCWCYLNSDMFYDKIMSSVNGATGSHQRFHAEETLNICIPYNKVAIQSFSTLIKPMLESVIKNEAEIRVLKNERDLLLPYLMNGKMTVNN